MSQRGRTAAVGSCLAVVSGVKAPPKFTAVTGSRVAPVQPPLRCVVHRSWPARRLSGAAQDLASGCRSDFKKRAVSSSRGSEDLCSIGKISLPLTTIKCCTKFSGALTACAQTRTTNHKSCVSDAHCRVDFPSREHSSFETCNGDDNSSDNDAHEDRMGGLVHPLTAPHKSHDYGRVIHETSSCMFHTALCSSDASDIDSTQDLVPLIDKQQCCIIEHSKGVWEGVSESTASGQSMSLKSVRLPVTTENVDLNSAGAAVVLESSRDQVVEDAGADGNACDDVHSVHEGDGTVSQEVLRQRSCIKRRAALPFARKPKMSLWSILRHCIGKDLSYVSMPIVLNEPISLLQRLCEDFEHVHLLYEAARRHTPVERLLFVSVFSATPFAAALDRYLKPFNPLLGETYEFSHGNNFRYFAEQVSHHPPITAFHVESAACVAHSAGGMLTAQNEIAADSKVLSQARLPLFEIDGDTEISTSFSANSVTVTLHGTVRVVLRSFFGDVEEYHWRRPKTVVHNLFVGNTWTEVVGPSEVTSSHPQQLTCHLEYIPKSAPLLVRRKSSGRRVHVNTNPCAPPRSTRFRRNSLKSVPSRKSSSNSAQLRAGFKVGARPHSNETGCTAPLQELGEATELNFPAKDVKSPPLCSHARRHSVGCVCRRNSMPHSANCLTDGNSSTARVRNRHVDADFVCHPSCLGLTPLSNFKSRHLSNEDTWMNSPVPQDIIGEQPNLYRLSGQVKDMLGNVHLEIGGHWNKLLWVVPTNDSSISFADAKLSEADMNGPVVATGGVHELTRAKDICFDDEGHDSVNWSCTPTPCGTREDDDKNQVMLSRWCGDVEELVHDTQNVVWMRYPKCKHLLEGYGITNDAGECSASGPKLQPDPHGMTPICVTLNELTEDYDANIVHMPPTDSRYRPDQRLYEQGQHEDAQSVKLLLEGEQRARAKLRALSRNYEWKDSDTVNSDNSVARWFEKVDGPASGLRYKFTGEYWHVRDSSRPFERTTSIFATKSDV